MGKHKRSLFAIFLNTNTSASPVWNLMGNGITSQTVNYNPQTSEENYIHQDSGTTDVESYKPTIPTPQTAMSGDSVFAFVDNLRKNRAVLEEARADVVMVNLYETAVSGAYPAEKSECSIQVDDYGGEGGSSLAINYTVNLIGDPVEGMFNPTTKVFTADSNPEQLVTFSVIGTASARLSGAQVVINGTSVDTDANGIADIQLADGTYDYTVIMTGYTNETGSVTVSGAAKFEAVSMTAV